jgi:peptidoglycan hydrolase-like protein with peptidoglycan-binding domain
MTPKTKIVVASSAIIIIGGIMISEWFKNNKIINGSPEVATDSLIVQQNLPVVAKLSPVSSFPLKKGLVGIEIKDLQNWLNKNKYTTIKLDEDGKFGVFTEIAVKNMQTKPKFSNIIEYKSKEAFTDTMQSGIISKNFYDYFITQTKKYPKTQTTFPFNL